MKKQPNLDGVAASQMLYDFADVRTKKKIVTRRKKYKLYASRCADDKVPFIQIRRES